MSAPHEEPPPAHEAESEPLVSAPPVTLSRLATRWNACIDQNRLTEVDIEALRDQMQKACAQRYVGNVALHDIDPREIESCVARSGSKARCAPCVDGARCYAHGFHIVRYTRAYFTVEWAARERLDVDIDINTEAAEPPRRWLSALLAPSAQPRLHYVLYATRSTSRCRSPRRDASVDSDENMPPPMTASAPPIPFVAQPPRLGDAWRDVHVEHQRQRLASDQHGVRRRIEARLDEGLVGPYQLFRMNARDMQTCTDDGAGAGPGGGCSLCRQQAPILASAMHIVPYSYTHLFIDWLVADEHLEVAIEYAPASAAPSAVTSYSGQLEEGGGGLGGPYVTTRVRDADLTQHVIGAGAGAGADASHYVLIVRPPVPTQHTTSDNEQ